MHCISRRSGSAAANVIVVVAILAIAGGAVWYFMLRSTPEKAVATMIQAQIDGDEETLKSVLTEDSQRWASMAGSAMNVGLNSEDTPEYEIGKAEIDGEQAKVPVAFPVPERMAELTNTTEISISYVLHREDGVWKVDLADTMKSMMGDLMRGGGAMTPPGGADNE